MVWFQTKRVLPGILVEISTPFTEAVADSRLRKYYKGRGGEGKDKEGVRKQEVLGRNIPLLFFHYRLWVGLGTDRIENTASNTSSIGVFVFVAVGTCLPSRCLAVAVTSVTGITTFGRRVTLTPL
jgi:hypothetical protein